MQQSTTPYCSYHSVLQLAPTKLSLQHSHRYSQQTLQHLTNNARWLECVHCTAIYCNSCITHTTNGLRLGNNTSRAFQRKVSSTRNARSQCLYCCCCHVSRSHTEMLLRCGASAVSLADCQCRIDSSGQHCMFVLVQIYSSLSNAPSLPNTLLANPLYPLWLSHHAAAMPRHCVATHTSSSHTHQQLQHACM
jgi:hypothetical protein